MSNNFKRLLTDNVIEPATKSRSTSIIEGIAIKVNEKSNLCTVKFSDTTGKVEIRDSVPVFIYNKSIIDWFPNDNEKVLLQEKDRVLYIVGPASQDYSKVRSQIKLENDVFSDTLIGGIGGYLF